MEEMTDEQMKAQLEAIRDERNELAWREVNLKAEYVAQHQRINYESKLRHTKTGQVYMLAHIDEQWSDYEVIES